MKSSRLMVLIIGVAIVVSACSKDDLFAPGLDQSDPEETTLKAAKKPAAKLVGIMALDFNLLVIDDPTLPVWEGTIDFGVHGIYGMRFFNIGGEGNVNSKASPFEEIFEIYELADEDVILLAGHDEGVTTLANSKYRMNGEIEVANVPFEMWLGRKVHMSGDITWVNLGSPEDPVMVPETAPGVFRIN